MTTHTYSWGEFFETMRTCDGFEEQKEKFAIFEALDKATTKKEIRKIVKPLTQEQINWLNSPCLDGIIATIENPEQKFLNLSKEFLETFKYYQEKNLIHDNNDSWLVTFCTKGCIEIVRFLLTKKDIDVHFGNDAPLLVACCGNNVKIVELLIQNGADIHAQNYLIKAVENGTIEIVKFLLDNGIDIRAETDILPYAVRDSTAEIVRFLLEKGANVNTCDLYNEHDEFPNIENIKLLLEYGANVHINNEGALKLAFKTDNAELVKLFIKYGADPTVLYEEFRDRFACIAALPPQNIP